MSKQSKKIDEPSPMLFLDDHRGIYIPRDFAKSIHRHMVTGVSDGDWACLENPEHEWYWEAWDSVLQNAKVTDPDGVVWMLHQDGALWLIPEGMEWSDDEEFFIYPGDESERA